MHDDYQRLVEYAKEAIKKEPYAEDKILDILQLCRDEMDDEAASPENECDHARQDIEQLLKDIENDFSFEKYFFYWCRDMKEQGVTDTPEIYEDWIKQAWEAGVISTHDHNVDRELVLFEVRKEYNCSSEYEESEYYYIWAKSYEDAYNYVKETVELEWTWSDKEMAWLNKEGPFEKHANMRFDINRAYRLTVANGPFVKLEDVHPQLSS